MITKQSSYVKSVLKLLLAVSCILMMIPFVAAENTTTESGSVDAKDLVVSFPPIVKPGVEISLQEVQVQFPDIAPITFELEIPKPGVTFDPIPEINVEMKNEKLEL